jgi:hypothetical protein
MCDSEARVRALKAEIGTIALAAGFSAALAQSTPPERAAAAKPTKQPIMGAWRLVGIDYSGPNGALADPVFGPNPQGIIIYDQSGWMSVQIVTANRPAIARPATRTSHVVTPDDAKLAAAAFDTYYAYFGTWDYNPDTSVITHHLSSSLLPYETGLENRQEVRIDGGNLKLSARSYEGREEGKRTLVWTRISDSDLTAALPAALPASAQGASTPLPVVATKYGEKPTDYQVGIRNYFQEHLKNAESIQYWEITKPEQGFTTAISGNFKMSEKREYGWTIKATINAKNSHDSYVGFKTYTFLFPRREDHRCPLALARG